MWPLPLCEAMWEYILSLIPQNVRRIFRKKSKYFFQNSIKTKSSQKNHQRIFMYNVSITITYYVHVVGYGIHKKIIFQCPCKSVAFWSPQYTHIIKAPLHSCSLKHDFWSSCHAPKKWGFANLKLNLGDWSNFLL